MSRDSDYQTIREIFPCRDVHVHVRLVGWRDVGLWKLCDVEVKTVTFPTEDGDARFFASVETCPELCTWAYEKAKAMTGLGDQWEVMREEQFRKMGIA